MTGFDRQAAGKDPCMAVDNVNPAAFEIDGGLEPVVILGLLNSMSVIIGNAETLLGGWDSLSADGESARVMLERISAHARVVSDALELAARELPPTLVEATLRPQR
jgi:hypothetical protein